MADDRKEGQDQIDRRGFLRTAGATTAGTIATTFAVSGFGAGAAYAQGGPGRLPLNTPIGKLGFNQAEFASLTPAAQKLTKAELFALQEWGRTRQGNPPDGLTIKDINSLEVAGKAMQERLHKPGAAATEDVTACCCCCPCCSCTAASVVQPTRPTL
ncbi:MAG: hypothetical protein FJ147_12090 [Deltaproteobacteria bacterium]|nr:hypothetical protein [Deltaproteobacteria bacterium]